VPTANANILTDPAATFAAYDIFGAKTDESGSERSDAECGEWAGAEWPTEIDAQLIKINRWLVGSESAGIAGNTTTLLGNFTTGNGTGSPSINLNKSDADTAVINFYQPSGVGNGRWSVQYDASENLNFQRRDNTGSLLDVPLSLSVTTALATFSAGVKVGGALDHDGSTIGLFGATPTTKPTITGSRGGNAALADLLTKLATLGALTDSTSA
jgi:hypothetical protein